MNNLASCMEALGDAAGALRLKRRALESREHVLGAEHPDTLSSVNNLAECLRALGDAARALPLYRRALESSERALGAEHPQTLTSVNNLAVCMAALGHMRLRPCRSTVGRWKAASACSARSIRKRSAP